MPKLLALNLPSLATLALGLHLPGADLPEQVLTGGVPMGNLPAGTALPKHLSSPVAVTGRTSMLALSKSILSGTASRAVTFGASILALACTDAFVMSRGFPLLVWEAAVVFGVGATLVAFFIHLLAIRTTPARTLPALLAFAATVVSHPEVDGTPIHEAFRRYRGFAAFGAWSG